MRGGWTSPIYRFGGHHASRGFGISETRDVGVNYVSVVVVTEKSFSHRCQRIESYKRESIDIWSIQSAHHAQLGVIPHPRVMAKSEFGMHVTPMSVRFLVAEVRMVQ